ncbi:hypothetical protein, partial [Bacteroides heparinolyticus]|uniref:hypothetical protein n=1 Tax=Prevotella heparinolytica TaxID=28113 RepID=UPI0035A110A4
ESALTNTSYTKIILMQTNINQDNDACSKFFVPAFRIFVRTVRSFVRTLRFSVRALRTENVPCIAHPYHVHQSTFLSM